MGNSASSGRGHHEETVDFGHLTPQGIYTGSRDWNQTVVAQLICERKLAPFYRPLEDYDESWDDEQILAHRKEPSETDGAQAESSTSRAESSSGSITSKSYKRGHANNGSKDVGRHPEAAIYRGAVECPICFLYYPPNINHSRCCDQAICTECFVQIKRAEPNPTHLVSEPASCPYCVQENFGVVYTPPPWRTGSDSNGAAPPSWSDPPKQPDPTSTMKRPRKSFGADSPEVVTVDQVHPDWEAKLAAVRQAVARRANRRIIMRQVGDRLIPVGISSGRVHPLQGEDGQAEPAEGERTSRRSRRRQQQNQDFNQLLGTMGLGGQDLEELMVMEAMRLSLLEHEEQQRRQREEEEKKKKAAAQGSGPASAEASEGAGSSSAAQADVGTAAIPDAASASSTFVPSVPEQSTGSTSTTSTPSNAAGTPTSTSVNSAPTANDDHDTPETPIASEPTNDTPSEESDEVPVSQVHAPVGPSDEADADGGVPILHALPMDRQDSLASSLAPSSAYDVLSSSPESSISHKPLLRSRPPTPLAAEPSTTATT